MYYVYMIQSEKTGLYYIGQTNNLADRIKRHNTNRNKFTKNKGPWKLLYCIKVCTRSKAMNLERKLKAYKNPDKVLEYFKKVWFRASRLTVGRIILI